MQTERCVRVENLVAKGLKDSSDPLGSALGLVHRDKAVAASSAPATQPRLLELGRAARASLAALRSSESNRDSPGDATNADTSKDTSDNEGGQGEASSLTGNADREQQAVDENTYAAPKKIADGRSSQG